MLEKATERRSPPFVSMSRLLNYMSSSDLLPTRRRLVTFVTTTLRIPLAALVILIKGLCAISFLLAVRLLLLRGGARFLRTRPTTDADADADIDMAAEARAKTQADAAHRELEMLDPEAGTCPICQEPTGLPNIEGIVEGWSTLPCGHKFGSYCIKHYLRVVADDRPSCPVCRNIAYHKCGHPVLPTLIDADTTDPTKTEQQDMNKTKLPPPTLLGRGLAYGRCAEEAAPGLTGKAGEAVETVEESLLPPSPSPLESEPASPFPPPPLTAAATAQRAVDMMKHSECTFCVERQAEKRRLRFAARAQAQANRATKDVVAIPGTKGVSARCKNALGWFRSLTWRIKKIAKTTSAELPKPRDPSDAGSSTSDGSTASDEGSEGSSSSTSVSEAESETNGDGSGGDDALDEEDTADDGELEEDKEEEEEEEEVRVPGRRPTRSTSRWTGPWIDPFPRQRDAEWETWWVKQEPVEQMDEVGSMQT